MRFLINYMKGHFGIDRTKLHARDSVYWPSINRGHRVSCQKLVTCAKNNPAGIVRIPQFLCDIPTKAWTNIQMDLFTLDNQTFILVVYVTSQFPVVKILRNEMTTSVINALKGIYRDFGLPRKIISDNGPCFRSEDF